MNEMKDLKTNPELINLNDTNDNLEKINNKVQIITCHCGKSFEFDWSKIPDTEKILYMSCPYCNSEIKRGNPYCNNEQ